jgi:DNA-binding response OmpR family regulator
MTGWPALGVTLQDTIGREVRAGSSSISLPRHELAILEHLMRRVGRVVPRAVLEDKLYGLDEPFESNVIPVHVHHLRRRLAEGGATPVIHTVRGIGYLLTEKAG